MKKYFLLIVLSVIGLAQGFSQGKNFTELQYHDNNGVPVVEVVIKDNTYRFMLDTGTGMSCVSDRLVNAEKLEYSQSQKSMQGLGYNLYVATIPQMQIGNIETSNVQGIVMSVDNVILSTLGVDGIIGADILMNYVVTFNSLKKIIVLSDSADEAISDWQTLKLWNNAPIFEVKLQGKDELYDVPALFDSGNGTGALTLPSVEGFEQWSGAGIIANVIEGRGAVGSMVGGLAKYDKIYRGKLNDFHVGNVVFKNLPVMTGGVGYLQLCYKMTDLGQIIIDYPNKRYKFEPFENGTVWPGDNRTVMTGLDNGKLRIAAVWGDKAQAEIEPGYIITAIGEKTLSDSVDSLPNIDELIRQYGAENAVITVQDKLGSVKELPASLFLAQ
ncbi:retropepsin-like aspartic protease [Plebeiibacterium sediminum]|uniref:Retroviral-like aspartic protease family protein n=1 Tax=Plebeiibacterium sediminum TaxID=2992112 RepID=A0AAE3M4E2_9BACT|nr:retropepsin-like aspartic protease [Plebeiobacterium sediminum]MCW3786818.1 retroviral-like aspartic protease family protein [Plebeiobacterium sediminum]